MRAWLCLLLGHATAVQDNVGGDCYCERCSATLVRMAKLIPLAAYDEEIERHNEQRPPKSKPSKKKK